MARPATPKVSKTPPASFTAAEKRQIELRIECLKAERDAEADNYKRERDERIRAEAREKELQKQLERERQDGNVLRTMVHGLEIDYAKLCGYIDGRNDSEPPIMVPERREPRFASYPDGTRRFNPTPYATETRNWYERR